MKFQFLDEEPNFCPKICKQFRCEIFATISARKYTHEEIVKAAESSDDEDEEEQDEGG